MVHSDRCARTQRDYNYTQQSRYTPGFVYRMHNRLQIRRIIFSKPFLAHGHLQIHFHRKSQVSSFIREIVSRLHRMSWQSFPLCVALLQPIVLSFQTLSLPRILNAHLLLRSALTVNGYDSKTFAVKVNLRSQNSTTPTLLLWEYLFSSSNNLTYSNQLTHIHYYFFSCDVQLYSLRIVTFSALLFGFTSNLGQLRQFSSISSKRCCKYFWCLFLRELSDITIASRLWFEIRSGLWPPYSCMLLLALKLRFSKRCHSSSRFQYNTISRAHHWRYINIQVVSFRTSGNRYVDEILLSHWTICGLKRRFKSSTANQYVNQQEDSFRFFSFRCHLIRKIRQKIFFLLQRKLIWTLCDLILLWLFLQLRSVLSIWLDKNVLSILRDGRASEIS